MTFKQRLFIIVQYITPQHLLSRTIGFLAETQTPWFKNKLISWFINRYKVNMSEAIYESYHEYKNFNEFFTRPLKEGMRPIDMAADAVVCPADGAVSELGTIREGRVLQAKGHDYSLADLLGGDTERAKPFLNGEFATIYLSPKDYHRVHMPVAGTLTEMIYVPGQLFSVNQTTAENVSGLFARNERVVCIFETEYGKMAVVLVGAMIVASIETVWAGLVTPPKRVLRTTKYGEASRQPIVLEKGAELGRFKLGSTAIIVFEPNRIAWNKELKSLVATKMGQRIATITAKNS
ncbi:archaetidylserine decarboxylase [Entomomonas asaccharolytica]|uniref:Phosphatidylserine decarboxylase proenzyme n=1 Tax=Entomomonas asaccharolytica TaxID=2785331 RepID=A0A974NDB3_9GAMM|nr:archaetidylserine decarboxylase [Entomomonas asaccharolytica]QQP84586.1 phosphatidylserine decarboxylase [Entomomonas asaccharolytica]